MILSMTRARAKGESSIKKNCWRFSTSIAVSDATRSEEHTSELQSRQYLVCRLLLLNDKHTHDIYTLSLHDALPISHEIIYRQKQGFDVPIKHWFNNEMKRMIDDTLNDSRTRQRGIFNQKELLAVLDEHRSERRDKIGRAHV